MENQKAKTEKSRVHTIAVRAILINFAAQIKTGQNAKTNRTADLVQKNTETIRTRDKGILHAARRRQDSRGLVWRQGLTDHAAVDGRTQSHTQTWNKHCRSTCEDGKYTLQCRPRIPKRIL